MSQKVINPSIKLSFAHTYHKTNNGKVLTHKMYAYIGKHDCKLHQTQGLYIKILISIKEVSFVDNKNNLISITNK